MRWRFTVLALAVGLGTATSIAQQPPATTSTGDGGLTASADATSATATLPAAPATADDAGTMSGEQYEVRLRDLEQRINELKEEIFRSKARLSLLAESVLGNVVGGSRVQITHQNAMGSTYQLVSAVYSLDGAPILSRNDENGNLSEQTEFRVYSGQIGSGDHNLGVSLEYLGAGLPYMKGYRFRVRSTQSFTVPEGKAIQVRVVGYERGGPLESPESRPAIRYIQRVVSVRDLEEASADAGAGESPTPGAGGGSNQ